MRLVLEALVVVVILGVLGVAIRYSIAVLRNMRPARELPDARNHDAMARWILRQMNDDMVRCTVPEQEAELARGLLRDYGYEDKEIR